MRDRLSLSPVTISQCPFEVAFRVAAEAGFEGIGVRYNQLEEFLERGHGVKDVIGLARQHDLQLTEMAFLAEWQFHAGLPVICRRQRSGGADEEAGRLRERLRLFLERCAELECLNATAVPAIREAGPLEQAAEDFATLCDLARPYGVRMCLEFMGPAVQVRDLSTGWRIVATANRPNGGLLIDTFLFHQGGSRVEDLDAIPIDKIFSVQLADAKPLPRAKLNMLEDRVFPGEGVAGVGQVVSALSRRGYTGWWTVELFNPAYAEADSVWVARKARATASALLKHPTA